MYGKSAGRIAEYIGTRDRAGVASHFQVFVKQIKRNPSIEGADLLDVLESNNWKEKPSVYLAGATKPLDGGQTTLKAMIPTKDE